MYTADSFGNKFLSYFFHYQTTAGQRQSKNAIDQVCNLKI